MHSVCSESLHSTIYHDDYTFLHSYILLHVVVESFLLSSNYINIMQKQDISQYDIQIIYIDQYILINILI